MTRTCLILAALTLGSLIIACGGGGQTVAPSDGSKGVRGAGWMSAKKIIGARLKAPSTADFPWDTVTYSKHEPVMGAKAWTVSGAVDAQNSFGTMIRHQWSVVVVRFDDDAMGAVSATLDGDLVFELGNQATYTESELRKLK